MYIGGCKIDAVYLGLCALDKVYLGVCEVLSRGPVLPKWQAFVPNPSTGEMAGLVGGIGGVTNARTAPINLRNHDDLYGQQDALKVGYRGGRLVGSTVYGTDENGDPLPEMPWAARFPQAENLILGSRSRAGWAVVSAVITPNSVIGIDGAMAAATDADESAALARSSSPSISVSQRGWAVSVKIKKDVTYNNYILIRMGFSGDSVILRDVRFRPSDGAIGSNTNLEYAVEEIGEYWWLTAHYTLVSAVIYSVLVDCYPAVSVDGNVSDASLEGQIGSDAFELAAIDSLTQAVALFDAPIYTTSATVTRDSDDIQLDSANHDDTRSTYYLETNITGVCNILGDFLRYDGTQFIIDDGTNQATVTAAVGEHVVGLVYGDGVMRLKVDSTWSAEVSYDGTLLSGALDVGRDSAWPVYVRNLKRYAENSEAIIDSLMP